MSVKLTAAEIDRACRTIRDCNRILDTPLTFSPALSSEIAELNGIERCSVWLKLESLQFTQSYKIRGAFNKISQLVRQNGVEDIKRIVTASAGNHAQGVGFSARWFGIHDRTAVYMPANAPRPKLEATQGWGVTVIQRDGSGRDLASYDEARTEAHRVADETKGSHYIEAFNDVAVMAGQGTIAKEVLSSIPNPDKVVCPIGGGGLISGVGTYVRARSNGTRILGVEPLGFSKTAASLQGRIAVSVPGTPGSVADGAAVRLLGNLTFDVMLGGLGMRPQDVLSVSESRTWRAISRLAALGLMVEGAGAMPLACLLRDGEMEPGETLLEVNNNEVVVLIVTGANLALERFARTVLK